MASSGLRKMLFLIIFQHLMVYECWCVLEFFGHCDVFPYIFMTDVIAICSSGIRCALTDVIAICVVADVIAMSYVVDGVTTEADGITSC